MIGLYHGGERDGEGPERIRLNTTKEVLTITRSLLNCSDAPLLLTLCLLHLAFVFVSHTVRCTHFVACSVETSTSVKLVR